MGSLYFIFFFQEISFLSFRVSYILLFFPRYSIHNFFSKTSLSRSSPSCFVLENHFLCFWAFYILPFFPRNSIHPIFSKKFYLQNFFSRAHHPYNLRLVIIPPVTPDTIRLAIILPVMTHFKYNGPFSNRSSAQPVIKSCWFATVYIFHLTKKQNKICHSNVSSMNSLAEKSSLFSHFYMPISTWSSIAVGGQSWFLFFFFCLLD